jgi:F1F0 ATPase subunit 2
MMHDAPAMVGVALLAGVASGAIFFGGLWWTIRRGLSSAMPAAWFIGSFVLRTGIVVAGFYFVCDGDWRRLLAATLGFLAARSLLMRRHRLPRGSVAAGVDRIRS